MVRNILVAVSFFLACFLFFLVFQNQTIYKHTLGKFSDNWVNNNQERKLVDQPFQGVNNKNYIQWDGEHYQFIKKYGYDIEKAGGEYIFAFFPLFPLLWKIAALPPMGVIVMNYLFFTLALLILYRVFYFKAEASRKNILLLVAFTLPMMVVFFIPYTESVFLLTGAIGMYGLVKKKYWIYFIGFYFLATTRSAYTFLALSLLGAEVFFFIYHKQFFKSLKRLFLNVIPLFLGTFTVSIIQSSFNNGGLFKFAEAIYKYWGHTLAFPKKLSDWSHEGFAINVGIIFLIALPLMGILIYLVYNRLLEENKKYPEFFSETPKNYVQVFSAFYIVGVFIFIIIFQGGNIHGLSRYVLCTPFFFSLLFYSFSYLKKIRIKTRILFFSTASLLSILLISFGGYSSSWNFSDFGLLLLMGLVFFWLFQDLSKHRFYKIAVFVIVFFNLIWTTYLFNTYIANGWIYT